MIKYIVACYNKIVDLSLSRIFDTEKEALQFISFNKEIDKLHKEENIWIYKIVEVKFYD